MKYIKDHIDKRSNVPMYDQIKDYILLRILERKIRQGDLLPEVDTLANTLDIPRQAVKMAYQKLVDMHLVLKKTEGYRIYYVEFPDMFHKRLMTMTDAIKSMGLTPSIETFEHTLIDDFEAIKKMQFHQCSLVLRIKRVYKGDDLPIFVIEGNFPLSIFSELHTLEIAHKPFYEIFRDFYQVEITESHRIFTVVNATQEISEKLNLSKGMPVYYSMTTAKDQYGRHIEYGQIWTLSSHRIPMTLEKIEIDAYFK